MTVKTFNKVGELKGHSYYVNQLTISQDGRMLLSRSDDRTVCLWDIETSQLINRFTNPGFLGYSWFFLDNHHIFSFNLEEAVMWDTENGEVLNRFVYDPILTVSPSPDGHQVLIIKCVNQYNYEKLNKPEKPKLLELWDLTRRELIRSFQFDEEKPPIDAVFSPDRKHAAVCFWGSTGKIVRLLDLETGKTTFRFESASIGSMIFSPDSRSLLTGGHNNLQLWDLVQKTRLQHIDLGLKNPIKNLIMSLIFLPDGRRVISGSTDGIIRLWDLEQEQVIGRSQRNLSSISSIKSLILAKDNRYLFSAGLSSTNIDIWDLEKSSEVNLTIFKGLDKTIDYLKTAFGTYRHYSSKKEVLSNPENWPETHCFKIASVPSLLEPDSKQALYIGQLSFSSYGVCLLSLETGQIISQFDQSDFEQRAFMALFSPDKRYIVVGKKDCSINLYDRETSRKIQSFYGHKRWITSLAFSPNSRLILSGSHDATLRLWDIKSKEAVHILSGHTTEILHLAFSLDGRYALSAADNDIRVFLWDVENGQEVRRYTEHKEAMCSVGFSPDGRHLLFIEKEDFCSGNQISTLHLWDLKFDQKIPNFHQKVKALKAVFSTNSGLIATVCNDKRIRLFNLESREEIFQSQKLKNEIGRIAFSSNDEFILSSDGPMLRLWEVKSCKEIYRFQCNIVQTGNLDPSFEIPDSRILDFTLSSDGRYVYCYDNYKHIFELTLPSSAYS
jgi:WD40 repeat protein